MCAGKGWQQFVQGGCGRFMCPGGVAAVCAKEGWQLCVHAQEG